MKVQLPSADVAAMAPARKRSLCDNRTSTDHESRRNARVARTRADLSAALAYVLDVYPAAALAQPSPGAVEIHSTHLASRNSYPGTIDSHRLVCYHSIISVITGGFMVRTQIQITEEQAKAVKRIALSRHVSVAELIRRAVDMMVKSSPVADPEERLKRAIEIVGKFRSGKHDIAKGHDKYLADAYRK